MSDSERTRWRRRLRDEFHRLLELAPEARQIRYALLAQEDARLEAEVRRLVGIALEGDALEDEDAAHRHAVGEIVAGRFRLVRALGAGGMGEVFLAERCDEVERPVALKFVRHVAALTTRRSRREVRILARLSHPNIAGFVDAGLTESGEPWFAMDYVDGVNILDHCRRHLPALADRIRLLAKVCEAVHFAHSAMVLHRDLKPDNIMVDAHGEPVLLDFGIGKLLDEAQANETVLVPLTPGYASPEQLRGELATTLSDVYQLGLIAQDLLGDAEPAGSHAQSTRSGGAMPGQSAGAATARRLPRDLRRIITRATRPEPRDRYDSARALADDLLRWADGLPVLAHEGSLGYRMLKRIRRHPIATATIAILAAGLVATSLVAIDRAASEARQRRIVEQERNHAATTIAFLRDVFRSGDPQNNEAADVRARDLLTAAAAKLNARTDLDEATRGLLLTELAQTFAGFGMHEDAARYARIAIDLLRADAGEQRAAYFAAVNAYFVASERLGRHADIVALTNEVAPVTAQHEDGFAAATWLMRARARSGLGEQQAALHDVDRALAWYERSPDTQAAELAPALELAGFLRLNGGDARAAIPLLERAGAVFAAGGQDSRERALNRRFHVAVARVSLGDCAGQIEPLRQIAAGMRATLGPLHQSTLVATNQIAQCEAWIGHYAAAAALSAEVREAVGRLETFNPDQRALIEMTRFKIALYAGDTTPDLRELSERVDTLRRDSGPTKLVARARWMLGELRLQRADLDGARGDLRVALEETTGRVGVGPSAELGEIEDSLARCALASADMAGARRHIAAAVRQFSDGLGPAAPATLRSRAHQAWIEWAATRNPAALDQLETVRGELVSALGGTERPQVWQLDLLIDRIRAERALPDGEPGRRAHALEALQAAGGAAPSRHAWLTTFS